LNWLKRWWRRLFSGDSLSEDEPIGEVPAQIPEGRADISVSFTLSDNFDWEAFKLMTSSAMRFREKVMENHTLPDLTDPVWDKLNVDFISMIRKQGGWKVDVVFFNDDSRYDFGGDTPGASLDDTEEQ